MTSVLAVAYLLLQMTEVAQSVTCFKCTSHDASNCGVNFNPFGLPTCTGHSCTKGKTNYAGIDVVVRDCNVEIPNQCRDESSNGVSVRVCICNTDLCNSENRLQQSRLFILILVFISICFSLAKFVK